MTARFVVGSVIVVACVFISGCDSPPPVVNDEDAPVESPHLALDRAQWIALPPVNSEIEPYENSARAAQHIVVQAMPRIDQLDAWPRVRLFQILFGEAFELAHARQLWSPHMGLSPPDVAPASIPAREFYLYVLAGVVEKSPSLAWIDPRNVGDDAELVHPGTGEPGARLRVNLLGFDDARGVARAEISVIETSNRETGRTVDARWDGEEWQLTFHPLSWTR